MSLAHYSTTCEGLYEKLVCVGGSLLGGQIHECSGILKFPPFPLDLKNQDHTQKNNIYCSSTIIYFKEFQHLNNQEGERNQWKYR